MPRIAEADLEDPVQVDALIEILDSYARGPGGQNAPISEEGRSILADGLHRHPTGFALLAFEGERAVAAATCFSGFSTFTGKPTINVHDLAVLPEFQGHGIGRALLAHIEDRARANGCGKVTLEVHETNEGAKRLYRELGYGPWDTVTIALQKRV